MKTLSLFCALATLLLSSCGKDPSPATASSAQTATPSAQADGPVATATQTNTSPAPAVNPAPSANPPALRPPVVKPSPSNSEAAFCPLVELAGHYKPTEVVCETDGKTDKADTAAVPTDYVVAFDGAKGGSVTMKVGAKSVSLAFSRNPNTWADFQKNGTQCSNGAVKGLSQRCPGVKDASCGYTILARDGKLTAVFDRVAGTHTYECRSELAVAEEPVK